ncbi:hypothetical protein NH340_JMT07158 [Sarcoptes scabiei]|nr:hypothetical protein NH340_JMT07158 [Sarcoptes scabiei]
MISFYKTCRNDSSTIGIVMPSRLTRSSGWHYCLSCKSHSPPRSYHCSICNRCILRRDHHCMLTGQCFNINRHEVIFFSHYVANCIGHKNYRYFMSFVFQIGFGSIYASITHFSFIWTNMQHLTWIASIGSHYIPAIFFVLGFIDLHTACCNMISMLCIISAVVSCFMFLYHGYLCLNEQTTHERVRSIKKYRKKNWTENLRSTLGKNWFLIVFVSPLIDSPMPNDGLYSYDSDNNLYGEKNL